ncbi:Si dkeyp-35f12.3 [Branchiostoma belcheri]|nr:Si dkeyp-35f12.3 [Branchiostoma belcheri]
MGKKKQTKVTKKGGLIYSKAEWKEEYPAFRSGAGARGGGDENLVPRRPKKPDRERRARPYSEPVLSEINVDEPYDEEKAKTLDRPGRPKSVMVGGPEGRMKSPSRQPSRNLLSCLQIPEEQDEDEGVVQGDVPRIVVEEVDQPPTKRARQEPIRKPRDIAMETDLPIEAIHLAGPAKPGRDAKGSPAKPAGTGSGAEGSLERRGPGTKGKSGDEGRRGGTPEAEEKGKKKKILRTIAIAPRPVDVTARPVDDLAFAPADNMAAAPYQPEARVQAAPAFAARPEILPPRDSAPSDAARMIKISFPVEQGVQTSPKSPPTSPTYLSPTSTRPGSPESSPEHRRDGERGRPRQRKTPEGGQLEGEFLRRRSPLGDRYIVEKARLLDANVTPTDYAKMEAELESREARPNRSGAPSHSEIRSGAHGQAGLEYLVIGGLEHRSVPTQTTSSVFSRPSYTYTDTTADHAPDTHAVRKVITKEISVPSFQDVGQDISTSSQDITTSEETITQEYKLYSSSSSFKTIEMYGAKFTLVGPTPTVVTETMTTSHHGNGQPDTTALAQPGSMQYTSSGSYSTSTSYTIPGGGTTDTQHGTTTAYIPSVTTSDTTTSYTIPGGVTTTYIPGVTATDTQHVTTAGYVSRAATQQTQYTTKTGYVTVDGSPVQYSTSATYMPGVTATDTPHVTTTSYMAGGTTQDTQHGTSTTTTRYIIPGVTTPDTKHGTTTTYNAGVTTPDTTTTYMPGDTTPTTQQVTTTGTSVQYAVPHTTVVRREAAVVASSQTVQKTKAANREAAVVESSQDFEIRPLKMEEEVREEVTPKSPEVIVSNLSPVRETVATFEQPSEGHDPGATSQYKLNYMHFPGRDTTITVVKRLSAGPTTLKGGEGGAADLQAEVKPETKTVVTEIKSEVHQERVAEVSAIPAQVKVATDDLQETAPAMEARYEERAVDVPAEKASVEEEGTGDGSSSSTSDDHSDAAEKPVAIATDDDSADAGVAMTTAAPEKSMLGVEARVEPRETPEPALHAGKAEAGRGGVGVDLVGKVVMVAEVKPEPTDEVLKTGEGEEMRSVGREITGKGQLERGDGPDKSRDGHSDTDRKITEMEKAFLGIEEELSLSSSENDSLRDVRQFLRDAGQPKTSDKEVEKGSKTKSKLAAIFDDALSQLGEGGGYRKDEGERVLDLTEPEELLPSQTLDTGEQTEETSSSYSDSGKALGMIAEQAAEENDDDKHVRPKSDPTVQAVLNDIAHSITQLLEGGTQYSNTHESSQGDKRAVPFSPEGVERNVPLPSEGVEQRLSLGDDQTASFLADVSDALQVLKGSEKDMTPVNQPVNQPVSRPITAPSYSSPVNQTLSQPIRAPSSSSPPNQPIRSPGPSSQAVSQPIRAPSTSSPVNQASSQPIRAPEAGSNRPGELTIELEGQRAAVPLSRQDRPYERLKNIIEAIDRVLESEGEAKASSALPLHQEKTHPGTSRTISVQTMQASSSLSNKEVQTDEEVESEDDFLEVWAGRSPHAPSDRVIISRVPARRSSERRRGHTHDNRRPTRDEVTTYGYPRPERDDIMTYGDLRPTRDEVTTHDDRRPTLEEITVYRDGGCQTEFESDPELASPQGEGRVPLGQGREPGGPYEKWRWEEINVVIKHQQGSGKTDVEGVETTWKRVPDVGDGEGEETTGVFDDSYRANNWIYVGDDEELPSAQSTPKGSPVMHSMGTSTDEDDGKCINEDMSGGFSWRQPGRESTLSEPYRMFRSKTVGPGVDRHNSVRTCREGLAEGSQAVSRQAQLCPRRRSVSGTETPAAGRGQRAAAGDWPTCRLQVGNHGNSNRGDGNHGDGNPGDGNHGYGEHSDHGNCYHGDVRERTIQLTKQPGVQFGFRIQKSRPIVITEVDKDSPAERAGIRVGDILTSVQNRDVTDCKHSDAVTIIKQGPTDRLTLTVATTLGNTLRDMGGEPVATGYLYKLSGGRVGKQWRKRWFVLKKDNTLYYYKTQEDKEPLGTIVLANYTITPAHEIGRTHAFKASRFNTRTYYFSAASEEEMDMWSQLLNQASAQSAKLDVWLDISMNNVRLPALSIPEPDYHGYLSKLGYVHKVWRRRYCVLKDGCLYYYTDYNSKRAIGVAHFHGYRVEPMATGGKSHAFCLTPPDPDIRTFYFSADNEAEKLKWMECLADSLGRWIKGRLTTVVQADNAGELWDQKWDRIEPEQTSTQGCLVLFLRGYVQNKSGFSRNLPTISRKIFRKSAYHFR